MKGVNAYSKQLSREEIDKKMHREFVGGLWHEMGRLQFEFLVSVGLRPDHKFLDVGCGCLRGGVHFMKYLKAGHYYGLDINSSLIEAGKIEVEEAGLSHKAPTLMVDDRFSFSRFEEKFDFMASISLFTHLPFNSIVRCLKQAQGCLAPEGVYYSTFFEAPMPAHLEPISHVPGGVVTYCDANPFHYSAEELACMAKLTRLNVSVIGDWLHPRNQKMAAFSLRK